MLAFQGKLYTILVCRLLHAGIVCFRIGLRDCGPVRQYYVNVRVNPSQHSLPNLIRRSAGRIQKESLCHENPFSDELELDPPQMLVSTPEKD